MSAKIFIQTAFYYSRNPSSTYYKDIIRSFCKLEIPFSDTLPSSGGEKKNPSYDRKSLVLSHKRIIWCRVNGDSVAFTEIFNHRIFYEVGLLDSLFLMRFFFLLSCHWSFLWTGIWVFLLLETMAQRICVDVVLGRKKLSGACSQIWG